VTESEFFARIDEHLAIANDFMARGDRKMGELEVLFEDTRQFIRELTRRSEITMRDFSREMREMQVETRANTAVLTELSEDIRAQRGALLTVIDELREHGLGGRG
jgi:hypothetical protein